MASEGGPTELAVRELLPFLEVARSAPLTLRVEAAPLELLRGFYLFSISGLVLPQEEDDVPRFVERRFLNVLSAAHRAGWTVLTAVVGSTSGVKVQLGFMPPDGHGASDPDVFERILHGVLPGLQVQFNETVTVESFLDGKAFGGIVAGVPALKIDSERQRFSLPAVIRSLHGEDYALLLVSRPVSDEELRGQLRAVWKAKDECHQVARSTRVIERGSATSITQSTTEGTSETESRIGKALGGALAGAATGLGIVGAGIGASLVLMGSGQNSTTRTNSTTEGTDKHWSESLSAEQQNSVALELERLAERHADRLMKAVNVGEWETAITFATRSSVGRDALAGTLLGELARPSADVFPPRVYYDDLHAERLLLLPAADRISSLFPRSLASYLTSEELASLASPPTEQLPGYEIRRTPALSLTDARATAGGSKHRLGTVCDHGRPLEGVDVEMGPEDLAKHLFVCGLTGTGKTTTVKELLAKSTVPFLVLESAKRDYRQLLGVEGLRNRLKVFTVGDGTVSPLRMNPFHVMPGVSALVHIDFLKAIFNASFSLYGPMPYILEKCIHNVYEKRGWDLTTGRHPRLCGDRGETAPERYQDAEAAHWFPTLHDLKDEVQDYVRSTLEYRGELSDNIRTAIVTRLESLGVGAKGMLFGTSSALDIEALLRHPTVLELESLSDDDDKAFFVGMMLTFISEYRQSRNPALNPFGERPKALEHLLVIEEAHRLLKNVAQERQNELLGNPRGKAVEFFANLISEMRAMGQGVVVVEQIPTKILPDVIKNTNAKIVHRLVAADDQALISSCLGLSVEESLYLTSLTTGHALYLKEGMQRPVEVAVAASVPTTRISHERVQRAMAAEVTTTEVEAARASEVRTLLGLDGDVVAVRSLCSLAAGAANSAADCTRAAADAIHSALAARDRQLPSPVVQRYLSDRLGALLTTGVFRLRGDAVGGIVGLVGRLLSGDGAAAGELQQRLARGWGTSSSREGLVRRLSELVLDRVVRPGLEQAGQREIDRIVRSYFLVDVADVRREVVAGVTARLGGYPWTL
jgi:hypothetical protein